MVYFTDISDSIESPKDQNRRQIVLSKGRLYNGQDWGPGEKYIFRYNLGEEYQLLAAISEAAKDEKTNFDWYDAAVISFKLTQSLIDEADNILNNKFDPKEVYQT